MNINETKKILAIVKASYPTFNPENLEVTLNVWNKMFEGYEYSTVEKGVVDFISTDTSGFAPSVGQIINSITERVVSNNISDMEAWDMVRKAICDSTYHSQERFDEFPEDVQKAVGSPSQLRAWAMDMNYAEGVAQSNFLRTYKAVLARKKQDFKLCADKTKFLETKITKETERIEANG